MSEASNGAAVAPKKDLLRGTAVAACLAAVILAVAVLPAEYGIDPTGAGKLLGLTVLHSPPAPAPVAAAPVAQAAAPLVCPMVEPVCPAAAVAAAPKPVVVANAPVPALPKGSTVSAPGEVRALTIASKPSQPYRTDVMEVELAPGKGLEVKTHLAKGATLVFSWKTESGAVVNHDFHGEPVNAKNDEFESFILENDVNQSRGALIAPFTGVHGWYWKNKTAEPVKVVLHASGFYTEIFKK